MVFQLYHFLCFSTYLSTFSLVLIYYYRQALWSRNSFSSNGFTKGRFLTDASILTQYWLNILLYYILYAFKIYFFTKLIWVSYEIINEVILLPGKSYKTQTKVMTREPSALLKVTTPKAADCQCHDSTNLDGRKHIRWTKSFWRTMPHISL